MRHTFSEKCFSFIALCEIEILLCIIEFYGSCARGDFSSESFFVYLALNVHYRLDCIENEIE